MYTSVAILAFSTLCSVSAADALVWRTDYGAAQEHAQAVGKPLAVFVGSGTRGWEKVARGGKLSARATRLLAASYVPVYLNTDTRQGKRLAADLQITKGRGLVLSDATGQLQAFWHEGDLTDAALRGHLKHFADPERAVLVTETNPPAGRSRARTSAAPPVYQVQPQPFMGFSGGGGGGFGGGCRG